MEQHPVQYHHVLGKNSKSRSPQSEFNFIGRKNENNSVGRTQMKGPGPSIE